MRNLIVLALVLFSLNSLAGNVTSGAFDTSLYGFVKASSQYSDQAVASYNNINMSAPTNAVVPTRGIDDKGRMTFQGQQSRFGLLLKKEENLSSRLEFDFIDFSKSSPTTQMVPRVRIASVTYNFDEHNKMIVGQDWDLFSPTTTYTYDYVGLYFLAGNTGFMRQQAQFLHTHDQWEIAGALGMAGNNPGVTDSDLEYGQTPSYSGRISYNIDKSSRVGISGIYANLKYVTTNNSRRDAYGANAFYEQVFERLSIKSEFYYAQNLANIGALSIGKGTNLADVREYGGFFSNSLKLGEKNGLFYGVGFARVDNKGAVSPFSLAATGTISTTGLIQNNLMRMGYEHKFTPEFSWMSEYTHYNTSALVGADIHTANANVVETGVVLKF